MYPMDKSSLKLFIFLFQGFRGSMDESNIPLVGVCSMVITELSDLLATFKLFKLRKV